MEYLIIDNDKKQVTIKKECPIDLAFFVINTFRGTDVNLIFEDVNVTTKI